MAAESFRRDFGHGRTFTVAVRDLLAAPVDAIVNPANSGLSHGGGLAAKISAEAGSALDEASDRIVEVSGPVAVGRAVVTTAGRLPYQGVIHAVGPRMGAGKEATLIARAVVSSLRQADKRGWRSVAFPAISTGVFGVPKATCARAFGAAIPHYWSKVPDAGVTEIWLCLTADDYPDFEAVLSSGARA